MEQRTRIFILENDCGRLTSLMLWLEQFPEFEIKGALAQQGDESTETSFPDCDIVLLGTNAPVNGTRTPNTLSPSIVFLQKPSSNEQICRESDAVVRVDASLYDLYDQLRKLANKRKIAISTSWLPASKAS